MATLVDSFFFPIDILGGSENDICRVSCTCPTGQHRSHRMAALLIHANKNVTRTETLCSWKAPSKSTSHA